MLPDHRSILPCVVFAFNRPNKLKRVLDAIRSQGIERLIVFVDGPRNDGDLPKVEACRQLARQVDWAPTEFHFWEENHGLARLTENIDLVMEDYAAAVVVEDDCLPMPGFYPFMTQALAHYRTTDQVFSIGGYQPVLASRFKGYPYSLVSAPRFLCWGWATWRERWLAVSPHLSQYATLFDNLKQVPVSGGGDIPAMARAMASGQIRESWDVKVTLVCMWLEMVHLLPVRGLVRNIGMDSSGIHGGFISALRDKFFHNRNIVPFLPSDLLWLEDARLNANYLVWLREFVSRIQKSSPGYWKQRLKQYFQGSEV